MYTKGQLVQEAFTEIGLAAYDFDLTSDEVQTAIRRLDAMAANWEGRGWTFGYNLPSEFDGSDPSNPSGIADTDALLFALNLAVAIAPAYGKTPSIETKVAARQAIENIRSRFVKPAEVQYRNTMPRGAGNRRGWVAVQNFYPVPDTGPVSVDEAGMTIKD